MLSSLLDLVLPSVCPLCLHSGGPGLCPDCAELLEVLPNPCPLCAEPLPATAGVCPGCRGGGVGRLTRCQADLVYGGPTMHLVHRCKGTASLSAQRALVATARPLRSDLAAGLDEIVPLPLSPARRGGLDLPAALAARLSAEAGLPVRRRLRFARPPSFKQQRLSLVDRQHNVTGLLTCKEDLKGRRILLVDDILTTGATADEGAQALRSAGATEVRAYFLCRTPRPGWREQAET